MFQKQNKIPKEELENLKRINNLYKSGMGLITRGLQKIEREEEAKERVIDNQINEIIEEENNV